MAANLVEMEDTEMEDVPPNKTPLSVKSDRVRDLTRGGMTEDSLAGEINDDSEENQHVPLMELKR